MPLVAEYAAAGFLVAGTIWSAVSGGAFQLRTADWQLPSGAADFMQAHQIGERMFNTYATGGYLVWRLWPMQKDFIDPRGLSEEAFADYNRILFNADSTGGKSAAELIEKYGMQVLVLEGFEPGALDQKVEQLGRMVAAVGHEVCGEELLSLSVGAAFYRLDGLDAEELLGTADRRMYKQKHSHREPSLTPAESWLRGLAATVQ